jgi:hypothetical protein
MAAIEASVTVRGMISLSAVGDPLVLAGRQAGHNPHGFSSWDRLGCSAAKEGCDMGRIVYVNGKYLPEEQGKISIFDRGFLFADGIYEVTAVIHGRLIDYAPHMERLERSLQEVRMGWPCSKDDLKIMHMEMIKRNKLDRGWIYADNARGRRPGLAFQGC